MQNNEQFSAHRTILNISFTKAGKIDNLRDVLKILSDVGVKKTGRKLVYVGFGRRKELEVLAKIFTRKYSSWQQIANGKSATRFS